MAEKRSIYSLSKENQKKEETAIEEILKSIEDNMNEPSKDGKKNLMKIIRANKEIFSTYRLDI